MRNQLPRLWLLAVQADEHLMTMKNLLTLDSTCQNQMTMSGQNFRTKLMKDTTILRTMELWGWILQTQNTTARLDHDPPRRLSPNLAIDPGRVPQHQP